MRFSACFCLLLLLAGCGALPQPFFGRPGATGSLLAQPPPSRLAVPTPPDSLLTNAGSGAWADAMAQALADQAIPASHVDPKPGDWTLTMSADLRGGAVVPTYTVLNSVGAKSGTAQGAPVPASLWATNDRAMLKAAAEQAAPGIIGLLTQLEAARLHSDPNSLQNRAARVFLKGVTGAPGDGNRSLADEMRRDLGGQGILVQDTDRDADFELRGEVRTGPGTGGTTRVELQWIVDDAKGERGRILQLNEVPAGSLDHAWGEVAVAAAGEAAAGVKDVLANAAGPRLETAKPQAATGK